MLPLNSLANFDSGNLKKKKHNKKIGCYCVVTNMKQRKIVNNNEYALIQTMCCGLLNISHGIQ
jgi:hypothetical protein